MPAAAEVFMRRRSHLQFASWLLLATFATAHSADVLTQHNDNQRTGVNDAETTLTPAKIKPDAFGKLWTLHADGVGLDLRGRQRGLGVVHARALVVIVL